MANAKTYNFELNTSKSHTNYYEQANLHSQTNYNWQVGLICHFNSMWFVPIMAIKCVRYENQRNDQFDLIRKGDVYPVIIEMDEVIPNPKRYLLINRNGQKQYWSSSDFEIIESFFPTESNPEAL